MIEDELLKGRSRRGSREATAHIWMDVETCRFVEYEADVITSDPYVAFLTNGKTVVAHVTGYDPLGNTLWSAPGPASCGNSIAKAPIRFIAYC